MRSSDASTRLYLNLGAEEAHASARASGCASAGLGDRGRQEGYARVGPGEEAQAGPERPGQQGPRTEPFQEFCRDGVRLVSEPPAKRRPPGYGIPAVRNSPGCADRALGR